jgi:hypothetical protein
MQSSGALDPAVDPAARRPEIDRLGQQRLGAILIAHPDKAQRYGSAGWIRPHEYNSLAVR